LSAALTILSPAFKLKALIKPPRFESGAITLNGANDVVRVLILKPMTLKLKQLLSQYQI
jgi:hypothetical protein